MQVLVIVKDADAAGWLRERLKKEGLRVVAAVSPEAASGEDLLEHAAAIILFPGVVPGEGVELVRQIRDMGQEQPLLLIASRADWRDKVACLDAGADDFIIRPVRGEEIAARIRAVIRRQGGSARDLITLGDIDLDLAGHCAWRAGQCLELTRNEFRLLRLFFLRPTRLVTSEHIVRQLYPPDAPPSRNAIEVAMARLRKKLGEDYILTIRNAGYRFNLELMAQRTSDGPDEPCLLETGE